MSVFPKPTNLTTHKLTLMEVTDFKAAFDAGLAQSEIRTGHGGTPFVVTPDGSAIRDLESLLPNPKRKRGTVTLHEVESFVSYVNRHKTVDSTMLYGTVPNITKTVITAVFNDHGDQPADAGWRDHRAMFTPKLTTEAARWNDNNKKQMSQADFAAFLEENLPNIIAPDGAQVLEVARRLEATTTVQFASATRLDNGNTALKYEEATEARVGEKGELLVPTQFKIGIVLFEGGPGYELAARLKYRLNGKTLVLWYELVNPHLVIKDAVGEILKAIRSETSLNILVGDPDGR